MIRPALAPIRSAAQPRPMPGRLAATLLAAAITLAACGGKSGDELAAAGKAAMDKRDYAAAVIQFKSALQKEPESANLRLQLGLALLEAGDPVSALVELQKAPGPQLGASMQQIGAERAKRGGAAGPK